MMPNPPKPLKPELGAKHLFGAEVRFHRGRLNLTQAELGSRVHLSESQISKLEKATRTCTDPKLASLLDQVLDTGGTLTRMLPLVVAEADKRAIEADNPVSGFSLVDEDPVLGEMLETSASTTLGEFVDRRRFLASSAGMAIGAAVAFNPSGPETLLPADLAVQIDRIAAACIRMGRQRRIGRADLTRLSAIHSLYQSLDYQYGGGLVYESMNQIADASSALLDSDYPDQLRPELLNTVANLRLLAGWTAFDMCDHSAGQRHFAAAERLAVRGENMSLAVYVSYCQARQLQHLRHNRDAIEVLQLAYERFNHTATPGTRSVLEATIAPSLAALGDRDGAVAALNRAGDEFERMTPEDEPPWIGWMDQAELYAQFGRVYRDFARQDRTYADQAAEWTRRAVEGFDEGMQRSSTLNQIGLCSAWFLAGEPESALQVGTRLLAGSDQVLSQRVKERMVNVGRDARLCSGRTDVDDFVHAISTR